MDISEKTLQLAEKIINKTLIENLPKEQIIDPIDGEIYSKEDIISLLYEDYSNVLPYLKELKIDIEAEADGCDKCHTKNVVMTATKSNGYKFICPKCKNVIYEI